MDNNNTPKPETVKRPEGKYLRWEANINTLKPITLKKFLALVTFLACLTVIMMILTGDRSVVGGYALFVQFLSILYVGLTTIVKTEPDELQKLNKENEILKKQIEQAELKEKLRIVKFTERARESIEEQSLINAGF